MLGPPQRLLTASLTLAALAAPAMGPGPRPWPTPARPSTGGA